MILNSNEKIVDKNNVKFLETLIKATQNKDLIWEEIPYLEYQEIINEYLANYESLQDISTKMCQSIKGLKKIGESDILVFSTHQGNVNIFLIQEIDYSQIISKYYYSVRIINSSPKKSERFNILLVSDNEKDNDLFFELADLVITDLPKSEYENAKEFMDEFINKYNN